MGKFDVMAPEPLAAGTGAMLQFMRFGLEAAGKERAQKAQAEQVKVGQKISRERLELGKKTETRLGKAQVSIDVARKASTDLAAERLAWQMDQDEIKRENSNRYYDLQKKRFELDVKKQQGVLRRQLDKHQKNQLRSFIGAQEYKLDSLKIAQNLKSHKWEFNTTFAELKRREDLKDKRLQYLEQGWRINPNGKAAILTGMANNMPTYRQDEKGNVEYVTRKEYLKMITTEGYVDDIDDPVMLPGAEGTGNPKLFAKSNDLIKLLRKSGDEIEGLTFDKLKLMLKKAKELGVDPRTLGDLPGLPHNATVKSFVQLPGRTSFNGMSETQRQSLLEDIQEIGVGAALKEAQKEGGWRHYQWMLELLDEATSMPDADIAALMKESFKRLPEKARKELGERSLMRGKIGRMFYKMAGVFGELDNIGNPAIAPIGGKKTGAAIIDESSIESTAYHVPPYDPENPGVNYRLTDKGKEAQEEAREGTSFLDVLKWGALGPFGEMFKR